MSKKTKTRLRDKTKLLLKTRPINLDYKQIEKDTGLKEAWLKAFASGSINNPDVNKIETLYEYLAKTELNV